MILLWTVFATSLLGSLHCAAMCGPFVAFYSGATSGTRNPGVRGPWTHVAYNGGRLITYMLLGAIAGAVGAVVDLAGSAAQIERAAPVAAGAFIVAWGVVALLRAAGLDLPVLRRRRPGSEQRLLRLGRKPPVWRAGALGLLTAALPCGWLYAFVVASAGTGSAALGAAVMFSFWLGTVPVMVGLGVVARRLARLLGRRLPVLTAALLIAVGLAAIISRPTIHLAEAQALTPGQEPACHHDSSDDAD